MKFRTVAELVELAESEHLKISDVMLAHEATVFNRPEADIFEEMGRNLDVMLEAIKRGLTEDIRSHSGLTGGDAKKYRSTSAPHRSCFQAGQYWMRFHEPPPFRK